MPRSRRLPRRRSHGGPGGRRSVRVCSARLLSGSPHRGGRWPGLGSALASSPSPGAYGAQRDGPHHAHAQRRPTASWPVMGSTFVVLGCPSARSSRLLADGSGWGAVRRGLVCLRSGAVAWGWEVVRWGGGMGRGQAYFPHLSSLLCPHLFSISYHFAQYSPADQRWAAVAAARIALGDNELIEQVSARAAFAGAGAAGRALVPTFVGGCPNAGRRSLKSSSGRLDGPSSTSPRPSWCGSPRPWCARSRPGGGGYW